MKLTVLFVSVAGVAPLHGWTNGHMVGGSTAAAAGQDTKVVVLPSTMVANIGLMPEGLGAAAEADDKAGASAGAPVGELATTLMPVAGVRQPRGV